MRKERTSRSNSSPTALGSRSPHAAHAERGLRKGEGTHRAATARSACLPVILVESWAGRAAWEDSRRRDRSLHARYPRGGGRRAHQPSKAEEDVAFLSSGTYPPVSHADPERIHVAPGDPAPVRNGRKLAAAPRLTSDRSGKFQTRSPRVPSLFPPSREISIDFSFVRWNKSDPSYD